MLPPIFAVLNKDVENAGCYIYEAINDTIYPIEYIKVCCDGLYNDEDTPELEEGIYMFYKASIRFQYWNTGFYITYSDNDTNNNIPIYEFDSAILRSTGQSTPLSTNTLTHVKRLRLIRQQRNTLLTNKVIASNVMIPVHVCAALLCSLIMNDEYCVISMRSFSELREIGITSCYHCFESASIKQWLSSPSSRGECAICRSSVSGCMIYSVK